MSVPDNTFGCAYNDGFVRLRMAIKIDASESVIGLLTVTGEVVVMVWEFKDRALRAACSNEDYCRNPIL